ncbi:dual specificity mitogen-activated protein kinase kinase 4 isoform X2 [Halyomorpha halys]|uniref:dual specificity mitogen-activated protein kinase kinase 4 isoform X2 n=1 Tax=Halyomorpha halys TaxID=286706 RepID=UPI0006D525AB|nr:dual specificity mitogen-activated protein kinase kinase 4 isoform X1 [Halyomorpha halys]
MNSRPNINPYQAERRQQLTLPFRNGNRAYNGSSSFQEEISRPLSVPLQLNLNNFEERRAKPAQVCSEKNDLTEKSHILHHDRSRVRRLRIAHNIHSTGILQVSPEQIYSFSSDHLIDYGEIGRGAFGTVNKMVHNDSGTQMAVKRIRSTVDEREQKQLLMDLGVVMKSNDCPYIVKFYGALFIEGDCWICMELMDTSLDKFYKFIYRHLVTQIPESVIGKIAVATVRALNYLKEHLKIIHRDVKPSNILLDRRGNIKLCDFGISGQLVDSIAKTNDAGCRPYMAPERIDPQRSKSGYDVRSDVWSLGITLMEVATGRFPYPKWKSVFDQLYQVVNGKAPSLSPAYQNRFSENFISFVDTCLIKEENRRPKYNGLLEHPFIRQSEQAQVNTAGYFSEVLDNMARNGAFLSTADQP